MICVPDWLGGTDKTGVERGPRALAGHLMNGVLAGVAVEDPIEIVVDDPDPAHAEGRFAGCKYLPEIVEGCLRTKQAVGTALQAGRTPLVLMGNDSMMVGVFAGIAEHYGLDYALAYFDAHGDINTPQTSESGRIYGMPLAHCLSLGAPELTGIAPSSQSLRADRIALFGARALDRGEEALIASHRIAHVTTAALNAEDGGGRAMDILRAFEENGTRNLFIHVDLDVLDPAESPGVSLHEPDGLKVAKLLELVESLLSGGMMSIGFSISEYNPDADVEGRTLAVASDLVTRFAVCQAPPGDYSRKELAGQPS
jgi:arginase